MAIRCAEPALVARDVRRGYYTREQATALWRRLDARWHRRRDRNGGRGAPLGGAETATVSSRRASAYGLRRERALTWFAPSRRDRPLATGEADAAYTAPRRSTRPWRSAPSASVEVIAGGTDVYPSKARGPAGATCAQRICSTSAPSPSCAASREADGTGGSAASPPGRADRAPSCRRCSTA